MLHQPHSLELSMSVNTNIFLSKPSDFIKMANRSIFGPDNKDPMDPGMEVFSQMVRRDTEGGGAEQLGVSRQI